MLSQGMAAEKVARVLVKRRNDLKRAFRANDPEELVRMVEIRNLKKYGHKVGADASWFFKKYGSWLLVIDAACRTANLNSEL